MTSGPVDALALGTLRKVFLRLKGAGGNLVANTLFGNGPNGFIANQAAAEEATPIELEMAFVDHLNKLMRQEFLPDRDGLDIWVFLYEASIAG